MIHLPRAPIIRGPRFFLPREGREDVMSREAAEAGLSWHRQPLRELGRLAWPIAVSMLSYSLMTLVDTLFVARLGPAPLAGVGLGGTLVFALLCFPMGLLRGGKVLVSQSAGAGEQDQAGAYLGAGLLLGLSLGLLGLLLGAHIATIWGSSVTGILFRVPGAAKSLALIFDGYPMTQRGEASRALGASATAALLGGLIGAVFLAISIPIVRPDCSTTRSMCRPANS